jgi:ribosomal protein L15E
MPSKEKPIWDKKRPESVGKSKSLSPQKKSAAKAAAEKAGRPYPNLVDNMRAARKSK